MNTIHSTISLQRSGTPPSSTGTIRHTIRSQNPPPYPTTKQRTQFKPPKRRRPCLLTLVIRTLRGLPYWIGLRTLSKRQLQQTSASIARWIVASEICWADHIDGQMLVRYGIWDQHWWLTKKQTLLIAEVLYRVHYAHSESDNIDYEHLIIRAFANEA